VGVPAKQLLGRDVISLIDVSPRAAAARRRDHRHAAGRRGRR
jgi:hypothetical protein